MNLHPKSELILFVLTRITITNFTIPENLFQYHSWPNHFWVAWPDQCHVFQWNPPVLRQVWYNFCPYISNCLSFCLQVCPCHRLSTIELQSDYYLSKVMEKYTRGNCSLCFKYLRLYKGHLKIVRFFCKVPFPLPLTQGPWLERVWQVQLHPSILGNGCIHLSIFRPNTSFTVFRSFFFLVMVKFAPVI